MTSPAPGAITPATPAPLAPPAARPGFADGVGALLAGFWFVMRTPAVWPLALVPVVIAGGVTAGATAGALHALGPILHRAFGPRLSFLATVAEIVVAVPALVVALIVGFGIAQPLSGPALNRIVRRAEAEVGAEERPASGLVEDVGRALQSLAVAYALGLPLLALLYVITFFFPPAVVVTFPAKLLVLALLVAWDLCDYPLSIHGMPVAERVAFVRRNLGAMVGFGVGLGLLSTVLPCLLVFVLPAGVAGAARLTRRIEQFERTKLPHRDR
jgi:CysZ protein